MTRLSTPAELAARLDAEFFSAMTGDMSYPAWKWKPRQFKEAAIRARDAEIVKMIEGRKLQPCTCIHHDYITRLGDCVACDPLDEIIAAIQASGKKVPTK
jgi:hypothetical protein